MGRPRKRKFKGWSWGVCPDRYGVRFRAGFATIEEAVEWARPKYPAGFHVGCLIFEPVSRATYELNFNKRKKHLYPQDGLYIRGAENLPAPAHWAGIPLPEDLPEGEILWVGHVMTHWLSDDPVQPWDLESFDRLVCEFHHLPSPGSLRVGDYEVWGRHVSHESFEEGEVYAQIKACEAALSETEKERRLRRFIRARDRNQ